jgi:hypothetical protein
MVESVKLSNVLATRSSSSTVNVRLVQSSQDQTTKALDA